MQPTQQGTNLIHHQHQPLYTHPAQAQQLAPHGLVHAHHTNQIQQTIYNQHQNPHQHAPQMIANHHYATQQLQSNNNGVQGHHPQNNYINHQNVNVNVNMSTMPPSHSQIPPQQPQPSQGQVGDQRQRVNVNNNASYTMGINNPKVQNRLEALRDYSSHVSNQNKLAFA